MNEKEIKLALQIAFKFLGRPYRWGGDDPMQGFDCSGFVIEVLKSVGRLPAMGDWTAAGLWQRFARSGPQKGALVFWHAASDTNKIVHVEMMINQALSIGAAGGGSRTMTTADAIRSNAYIKIRPYRRRPNVAGFKNPFTQ